MRIEGFLIAVLFPAIAWSQEPLSSIDWLKDTSRIPLPDTMVMEPPVSSTGDGPAVDVIPLAPATPPIGLVSSTVTGLPVDLWQGSDPARLADLISRVPVGDSPAMQKLLYALLLTESSPPAGPDAAETLLLARLDRLVALGASDPAQALVELAGPDQSRARFARWFETTLLSGDEDRACSALLAAPYLSDDYAAHIFCQVRVGDWEAAALTLEAVHTLELMHEERLALLDRFLSPDIFEGSPPLPRPNYPDALEFRLFETIGERLNTGSLPKAFANADLRDIAGWKAQIEAAERLTRMGVLPPNQLIGLYTERDPAASGGVWDRVEAIQRFDTAISVGNSTAIERSLGQVWRKMREVGLEVPFAELFAEGLGNQSLENGSAAELAWRVRLLSRLYEQASSDAPNESAESMFLSALAQGDPGRVIAPSELAASIADGFSEEAVVPQKIADLRRNGQLGEAILEAMLLFDRGARGNPSDLSAALASLRAMGLEDTARRAALELMLLGYG
ncbi:hypothetical protein ACFORG_19645 [Lutimaribacter marinistellae]|uniref:Uncharacterized protein n=1 Tax=Lutimaribacter marinistellae TaxID=1820329 RepID=A0ABV7TNE3_9RHOB